jgi:hypothetical protein
MNLEYQKINYDILIPSFVRWIFGIKICNLSEGKKTITQFIGRPLDETEFFDAIKAINEKLNPFLYQIQVRTFAEKQCKYLFIANLSQSDNFIDMANSFTHSEREIIASIVDHFSEITCSRQIELLNAISGKISQKYSRLVIQKVIDLLVEDGWLCSNEDNTFIHIGPRMAFGLPNSTEENEKQMYCKLCSEIVLVPANSSRCPNSGCNTMYHPFCVEEFCSLKASSVFNCLKCQNELPR